MNIKAVAKQAGVSVTTVSRVLNNPELVSENTRKRIFDVIEELDYTPNWFARNIQSHKTNVIGLIVSDMLNPATMEIAKGVEEVANGKKYSVNLCNTERDKKKEQEYLEMLLGRNVDGLILISTSLREASFKRLEERKIPYVLVGKGADSLEQNVIFTNNTSATKEAINYLASMDRKKIAILLEKKSVVEDMEKLQGYKEALIEQNMAIDENLIMYCGNSIEEGFVATSKLIAMDEKVDAIFTATDTLAFGVIEKLKQKNISIPEEIAIIGFDDLKVGAVMEPKLTTVSKPSYRMGLLGARLLFDCIEDSDGNIGLQEIMVQSKLKIRKSCGNEQRLKEIW